MPRTILAKKIALEIVSELILSMYLATSHHNYSCSESSFCHLTIVLVPGRNSIFTALADVPSNVTRLCWV